MKYTADMVSAMAQALESNVKLVHFFERYDKENKKAQDDVVRELDRKLDMVSDPETESIDITFDLTTMYKALTATKRARNKFLRGKMLKLINLIKKITSVMNPENFTKRAKAKLILLFTNLYTYQINDHIQYTSFLEDSIVFALPGDIGKTAQAYVDTTSNLVDSEYMEKSVTGELEEGEYEKEEDMDDYGDMIL